MHSADEKSFTLLELLVVITIIGILSSIVIVSMSGSTDSATIAKSKSYAQQVHALLGANAVGIWNFDEGTGITLTDISGYGNDGTLNKGANGTGLDWVASDIEGTALQFDGVDDYVLADNIPELNFGTNNFTLSGWINLGDNNSTWKFIFGKKGVSGSEVGYAIYRVSGTDTITLHIADGTSYTYNNMISLQRNEWYHVVVVRDFSDPKNGYFFINGEKKEFSNNVFAGDISSDHKFSMGRNASGGSYYFNGLIDEIHIYTEALDASAIQEHYVQGLKKLLTNQAITQAEYDQRMDKFNQSLVLYE